MTVSRVGCIKWCTPDMGVNLWGESPLYENQECPLIEGCYQKYEPKARAYPRGWVRRKPKARRASQARPGPDPGDRNRITRMAGTRA
jgi:hypothetical protein